MIFFGTFVRNFLVINHRNFQNNRSTFAKVISKELEDPDFIGHCVVFIIPRFPNLAVKI